MLIVCRTFVTYGSPRTSHGPSVHTQHSAVRKGRCEPKTSPTRVRLSAHVSSASSSKRLSGARGCCSPSGVPAHASSRPSPALGMPSHCSPAGLVHRPGVGRAPRRLPPSPGPAPTPARGHGRNGTRGQPGVGPGLLDWNGGGGRAFSEGRGPGAAETQTCPKGQACQAEEAGHAGQRSRDSFQGQKGAGGGGGP